MWLPAFFCSFFEHIRAYLSGLLYNGYIRQQGMNMAKRISKSLLRNAKIARQTRYNEELEELHEELDRLRQAGEDTTEILNKIEGLGDEYFAMGRESRDRRLAAKAEMRELKKNMPNRNNRGRAQIQWASPEARYEQRDRKKKTTQLAQVEEVGLMRAHRELSRWEIIDANRGIRRGEIMMVISETYEGYNNKPVVDVMIGADVFKGVPAKALRSAGEE